jgi:hypothetical protein
MMKEATMALILEPTREQLRALAIVRSYFNLAACNAQTHLMTISTAGSRGLVAAEFAQGFRRSSDICEMVLEVFETAQGNEPRAFSR